MCTTAFRRHLWICWCLCVWIYLCVWVRLCVWIFVGLYTHAHTHTHTHAHVQAHMATRSLDTEFTEEAFCALMKALDNICDWDHPHRDQVFIYFFFKNVLITSVTGTTHIETRFFLFLQETRCFFQMKTKLVSNFFSPVFPFVFKRDQVCVMFYYLFLQA